MLLSSLNFSTKSSLWVKLIWEIATHYSGANTCRNVLKTQQNFFSQEHFHAHQGNNGSKIRSGDEKIHTFSLTNIILPQPNPPSPHHDIHTNCSPIHPNHSCSLNSTVHATSYTPASDPTPDQFWSKAKIWQILFVQ